jgi:xanthine/CO dehydrogenase XdhC/CoxF family maturation factor/CTP:molybdopterin cytidylyltransferase MocA
LKEIYDILREFEKRRGQSFALATLVRAEGSSYRRPGARMLICEDGRTVGSLSAGCIEDEVALCAGEVLRSGVATTMSFDTRRRFGCNGRIDIFIEHVPENFLVDLAGQLNARRSCLALTTFAGKTIGSRVVGFDYDRQQEQEYEQELIQEIHPPIRLLIFGEGPDGAPLHRLSELLGWRAMEIVDPHALTIEPDPWTAAIVKSHNYGRDFLALQKLLPLNLPYVGLIGPRKRRDQLMNDLLDLGITINAGFFSPAGLDLRAETPEEIALAIISEIQRVFAEGSGHSLRERKISIHGSQSGGEQMPKIGAVILAAGKSSRLGQSKQLLQFGGQSLVRRVVDAAGEAGCSPVVVVIGSDKDKVARELERTDAVIVENVNWNDGMGTSIRSGVQRLIAIAPSVEAIVLLVCDQPMVDSRAVEHLIALNAKTKKAIVASSYAGTLGVPALFDRSCADELLALEDGIGAKSVIFSNPNRVADVPFPEGQIDIDMAADYEKLRLSED